jgi:hypothetical protein
MYNSSTLPDAVIFTAGVGFKVEMACHYSEDKSDSIHFVCPSSRESHPQLPCLKYIAKMRKKRSTYSYKEVSPVYMQR